MNKYKVYLLIGVLSASLSAVILRFSGQHPLVISFYRMLLTSIVLLPFAVYELKKNPLPKKTVLALIGVGAILATHFGLWNTSVQMTTVASATILVCSHPLFVVPLGQRSAGERLGKAALLGVAAAFIGIIILSYGDITGGTLKGDIVALMAGIVAGIYLIAGRKARSGAGVGLFSYVWIVYASCTMFTFIAVLALGEFTTSFPPKEWLVFLGMMIFPTILGHTMINASLKEIKAGVVSTAILAEPLGASILAVFLFSEIPPTISMFGGALILIGLVFVVRRERTPEELASK